MNIHATGRRVLVGGGSRGLGRAVAQARLGLNGASRLRT